MNEQIAAKAHVAGAQPQDYMLDRIESGEYAWQLANEFGCSEAMIRRWFYQLPRGRERYQEAVAERSHSVTEGGMQRIEDLGKTEVTKSEAMLLKLELDQRRFIAAAHNRPVYGQQQQQVAVTVNLDTQMLDAFKQTRVLSRGHITPQLGDGQPDIEVVPEGERMSPEDLARFERDTGISYAEAMRRSERVRAGEYVTHAEAMASLLPYNGVPEAGQEG